MNTTENNKLIAEFMGWTYHPETSTHGMRDNTWEYKPHYYHHSLLFHSSWDWLMPVVEKIESLDELGGIVTIKQGLCIIESRMLGDKSVYAKVNHYFLQGVKGKQQATHEAVVEFIKWYNQNKKL